ncbi:response regulator transcription factor [Pedobacter sp. BS3]|uniref:response regulator transcription factor n=1 Tax=Pedobacter sp. BS3 TaxID=2567937 RepID=UPI0011ECECD2|nr:LuxR C-terminal-related transcriptional regulator [Pedobacter sp. BS3]TZF83014.1 response regulator transcription factor [Pedobacter sp. BS3]
MASKKLTQTFESYLKDIYFNKDLIDENEVLEKLHYFKQFNGLYHGTMPLFFVIDYTRQQYLVHAGTNNVLPGYQPEDFLDGGMDILKYVCNKDDFNIYNREIFSHNCQVLKAVPQQEHGNYIFSHTYRVKASRNAQELVLLQRGGYITSHQTGLPLYSLGMCMDITPLKTETSILHTIEKGTGQKLFFQTIACNYFFPNQEDTLLTSKEKQVLLYMTEGLATKEIADKLKISEATVICHRKNMMKKTNTKNGIELATYCIRKKII